SAKKAAARASLDSRQPLFPKLIEEDGGFDIAQAVFGDVAETALSQQRVDIVAGDAMAFGRFDSECLAVKIQIETPRRPFASAHAVKSELLGQIAMRLGLIAIAEPILAGDRHVQEGRTQINKWHIEAAAIEGGDHVIMFGDVPKSGE